MSLPRNDRPTNEALPGSMLELFRGLAHAHPDQTLLTYFNRHLSAREVDELSDGLAGYLQERGLGRGDRTLLCMQNVPQYVIALIAVWKTGGVAVPANPMLHATEVLKIIGDSQAKAVIALDELLVGWGEAVTSAEGVTTVVSTSAQDLQTRQDDRLFAAGRTETPAGAVDMLSVAQRDLTRLSADISIELDDPAVITYTSGTTGVPKGAVNTHRNVLLGGMMYRDWFELTESDSILGIAPLFHVTGLSGHIAAALTARIPLVLTSRFEPGVVLDAISEHRPTFTVGAITAFIALVNDSRSSKDALSSLRVVGSGGAPIAPATLAEVEATFGCYIHNLYGLTETTCPVLAVPVGEVAPVDEVAGALSAGKPVFEGSVRVVDDTGHECGPREIGELLVDTPTVISEYWQRPEATESAFSNSHFRTGDVGFFDEEGWYFIVDRKKDMIIASGFKVWPREVEDVLFEHPAVLETAVVGIPHEYRGETVKAFVSLRPGSTATPEELIAFARERMAAYKYPREVEIVSEIPKTATGKLLRRAMRT